MKELLAKLEDAAKLAEVENLPIAGILYATLSAASVGREKQFFMDMQGIIDKHRNDLLNAIGQQN